MASIQSSKIIPCIWFETQAQEAASFYCSIFENSSVLSSSDMVVEFELAGTKFMAMNGRQEDTFNHSISFFITCKDQSEVDHFWDAFTSDGGSEGQCGWCKDRFGLSWQVIPSRFMEMMSTGSQDQVGRVMQAMMPMKKMVVADFEKAFSPA